MLNIIAEAYSNYITLSSLQIVFAAYYANLYFSKFSERRLSLKKTFWLTALFAFLQLVFHLIFWDGFIAPLLYPVIFTLLISTLYKNNVKTTLFGTAFLLLLPVISELIVTAISSKLIDITLLVREPDQLLLYFHALIVGFLSTAAILLAKFYPQKKAKWLPRSVNVRLLPLPLISFVVLLLLFSASYFLSFDTWETENVSSVVVWTIVYFRVMCLAFSILLIVSNIIVFYLADKQEEYIRAKASLAFAEAHIKNQIAHYTELYNYQNELKTFKHDFKNRLIALSGLIKNDDSKKALELIENDLEFLNNSNRTIVNSGNPVVDAIIQTKLNFALENNVKIKTIFRLSEPINIDEFELGVLIGNALDNAIEATMKIKEEKREPINVNLLTAEGHLSFSAENSVAAHIDTASLTTTKDDKLNHGYGLKSMKSIAQKYSGELFTDCENNRFTLTITMVNNQNHRLNRWFEQPLQWAITGFAPERGY